MCPKTLPLFNCVVLWTTSPRQNCRPVCLLLVLHRRLSKLRWLIVDTTIRLSHSFGVSLLQKCRNSELIINFLPFLNSCFRSNGPVSVEAFWKHSFCLKAFFSNFFAFFCVFNLWENVLLVLKFFHNRTHFSANLPAKFLSSIFCCCFVFQLQFNRWFCCFRCFTHMQLFRESEFAWFYSFSFIFSWTIRSLFAKFN